MVLEGIVSYAKLAFMRVLEAILGYLPNVFGAILVLYLGRYFAKLTIKLYGPVVAKTLKRPAMIRLVLRGLRYAIFLISFVIALGILGINITLYLTPLLAGAGIAGIIIGVTAAPIVSSYLAGIFIIIDRPYEIGERIEVLQTSPPLVGYIVEIGLRTTRIKTVEGNVVVVPNVNIMNKDIINYSIEDPRNRHDLPFGISYESDLKKATNILEKVARNTEGVVKRGKLEMGGVEYNLGPRVLVEGFGDSGINLVLRVWYKEPYHPKVITSQIYRVAFDEFKKGGIEIPYPHQHLVVGDRLLEDVKRKFQK